MPAAKRSEAAKRGQRGPEKAPASPQAAKPVPGADGKEATGLTAVAPPQLPPLWLEWGRVIAEKWPLPVFVLAVVLSIVVWLVKPKAEEVLSWDKYLARARLNFDRAMDTQDQRGEISRAVELLGGREGVLSSYQRAADQVGAGVLGAEDLARIGEALYRLARIRQDYPHSAGRNILMAPGELYRTAMSKFQDARTQVSEELLVRARKSAASEDEALKAAKKAAAAELGGPDWRRRRRMLAECHAQLGEYAAALDELGALIESMSAAQAGDLRREKSPEGQGPAGPGAGEAAGGRAVGEWAQVYELRARCHDRRGEAAAAARFYRLFLEKGTGGLIAQRARLRLAELALAEAIAEKDAARALAGFEEVCRLCTQVEQSDAPANLREDAVFLLGRASYRQGAIQSDPAKAKAAYAAAATAFRYPYSPGQPYVDMSRVLLARALFLGGFREEALELLDGILRIGAQPAIYACAEVSHADMFVESDPAKALGGNPRAVTSQVALVLGDGKTPAEQLGLRVKDAGVDLVESLGLSRGGAALITEVRKGGPGEQARIRKTDARKGEQEENARIRPGDLIVTFGSKEVYGTADLSEAVLATKPGTEVDLQLARPQAEGDLTHGYFDVIRRIRRLKPAEAEPLVPELGALLADEHFMVLVPELGRALPADNGQLLRLARGYAANHEYDQAARIYRHILENYPQAAVEGKLRSECHARYHFLLGELYAGKAVLLARKNRPEKEVRLACLAAARDFMTAGWRWTAWGVPLCKADNLLAADAYWRAGKCYFEAGRYDGASSALKEFTRRFGDDARVSEGLYLLGESFRRMGAYERAAEIFARASVEHPADQFGYQAHLALGETYMAMGRLEAREEEKGLERERNALAVLESIRRDARYTPESQVWMKALFRLGETYYLLGRSRLAGVAELEQKAGKSPAEAKGVARDIDKKREEARRLLSEAADTLEEGRERYPLAQYAASRPSFAQFLRAERLPVLRMLAMIHMRLADNEKSRRQQEDEYGRAHRLFAEILQVTGEVGAVDRAEADEYRCGAFAYQGIAEMRLGRFEAARRTFEQAHDEFARAPDGPWFIQAQGMALERAGQSDKAKAMYSRAANGFEALAKARREGAAAKPLQAGVTAWWLLLPEEWERHSLWAAEKSNG